MAEKLDITMHNAHAVNVANCCWHLLDQHGDAGLRGVLLCCIEVLQSLQSALPTYMNEYNLALVIAEQIACWDWRNFTQLASGLRKENAD